MNLYLRELSATRKSLIIWTISLLLLIVSGMGKYAGFAEQGDAINELLASMPEAIKNGMNLDLMNLTKVLDFYAYLFNYILLFGGIYAMRLGMTIITKEESDRTIEFLATKPIKRYAIITNKLLAAVTNIFILDIVVILASLIMIKFVAIEPYKTFGIWLHLITLFVFELIYLTIGLYISVFMSNSRKATSITISVVFIGYLISIVAGMTEALNWLKYLTPFRYFESANVFRAGLPNPIYFFLSLLAIIVSIIGTYNVYSKKEFKA